MGYNPVAQINESIDVDASSGKIQRQNILINIREDTPRAAYDQYVALRNLILGSSDEKKVNSIDEKKIAEAPSSTMICDCGQEMILREGRDGFFFGCSGYFTTGCRNTKPASKNKPSVKIGTIGTGKKENDDSPVPECPRHKMNMHLKSRRSDGQLFFGCALFDSKGCLETIPYPIPSKANIKVPSVVY